MALKQFETNLVQYDLLNKFCYKSSKKLPRLQKSSITFWCKTPDLKTLAASLLATELIVRKPAKLTSSKKPNLILKLKKGEPVGCKATLRKKSLFSFLEEVVDDLIPKSKTFSGLLINAKSVKESSFTSDETMIFSGLGKNYYLFNSLSSLHVTLVASSASNKEFSFLLSSLKLH